MGLFKNLVKKEIQKNIKAATVEKKQKEENKAPEIAPPEDFEEAMAAFRRVEESLADEEYQRDLERFSNLMSNVYEMYSVINAVGDFSEAAGDRLIRDCMEAMNIEFAIKEKREYYQNCTFPLSESCKMLAMVHEKRGEYQSAANACIIALENGTPYDGTKSGMRGRLARMIKKGNLPLTDDIKQLLNLQ